MNTPWNPRHVVTIVAIICAAAVLTPVAVQAVATQPVTIFGGDGVDGVDVNPDHTLNVRDKMMDGGALHYSHAVLTQQSSTAILTEYPDETSDFAITSIGVTALPAAKAPSYVQFRHVSVSPGQACVLPQPNVFNTVDLPALWAPVKGQAEYTFSPRINFDIGRWHCLVATLVSGGPVDAHATAFGLEANF